jgi:hypothetical protein
MAVFFLAWLTITDFMRRNTDRTTIRTTMAMMIRLSINHTQTNSASLARNAFVAPMTKCAERAILISLFVNI